MDRREGEHGYPRDLKERVRKVRHLGPVEFSIREDGRFRCELTRPMDELSPEDAKQLIRALEPIMENLREVAGRESSG